MAESSTVIEIRKRAASLVSAATSPEELEQLRLQFLGRKGEITLLMKEMKAVAPTERKEFGATLNDTKRIIEEQLSSRLQELGERLTAEQIALEGIDVTLPVQGTVVPRGSGSLHPLTIVQRELERIFVGLGFSVVDGPEVEAEYYNFEALNIPATHPARDMQDSFWTVDKALLRTHTSSIQVRSLEQMKPPLRIVAPGRCFRYERIDASHEHTFYQMEGMMIDRDVNVGHLIYFMKTLLREIFGSEQKIRLRPGYFPFVEPGFELDIWFRGRWLELLPCGLVHPRVLEFGGIDPNEWSGFAFGLGLSRLVMSRFQIDDIRYLQGADLRFLRQFR